MTQSTLNSSVIIIGSIALDDLELPSGKFENVLGGSAVYGALAASHFVDSPQLVGVVGEDFSKEHVTLLHAHGIDTKGLEIVSGKTFKWKGRYANDLQSRDTLDTQLGVFEHFQPKLTEEQRKSEYVFLGNIDPVLQLSVLEQVAQPQLVIADTMNFWIDIKRTELAAVLQRIDMLMINDEEATMLSGESSLPLAAKAILAMGPTSLVIKRGDAGAVLFHEEGMFTMPAIPLPQVLDPTGAGDTFAGGFIGYVAQQKDTSFETLKTAVFVGSAMASLAVETVSVAGISGNDKQVLAKRIDEFGSMMAFGLPTNR